jgi:hypothetical protein
MLLMVRLNENKKKLAHTRICYSLRTRYFGRWILWEQKKKVACTRIIEIGDENEEGTE